MWRAVLTATAIAVGLILPAAPVAVAADRPVDVTKYSVSDYVFDRGGCKKETVKVSRSVSPDVEYLSLSADVTFRGSIASWVYFSGDSVSTRLQLCPFEERGAYKIGPTEVSGSTQDGVYFDYLDSTSKTFYVRGKAKAHLKASRSGSKVTLTATAKYFNPKTYDYSRYSPQKAKFQVKSGSKWKTIKTVNFKSGKSSYTFRKPSKATYRVTFSKTSKVTAATSSSIRK